MYERLISSIINNSLKANIKGRRIMISVFGFAASPLVGELSQEIVRLGGTPEISYEDAREKRIFLDTADESQIRKRSALYRERVSKCQANIRIFAEADLFALTGANKENLKLYNKLYGEIREDIVLKGDWVLLNFPTSAYSTAARMPLEEYGVLWKKVTSLDYSKMKRAMTPLKDIMEKTDRVHIKGPGTDLEFSIRSMPAILCTGECNIPDGEIFSAPIRNSVNGVVQFNTPLIASTIQTQFENIRLEFKDGRIVSSHSSKNDASLKDFLDADEGARYTGEFALGVNPYITSPLGDILFDEKISGSFHIAAGRCYDECNNKNRSTNHFDMICVQTPEYGGGEIFFDGKLIRKDGRFTIPELESLNPENLI